jgi:hypothetical protein
MSTDASWLFMHIEYPRTIIHIFGLYLLHRREKVSQV